MSVRILDFYAPLPQFGVNLNQQWDKFRTDFVALNALVRNSYIDESSNLTTHVLNALAYGELAQRFKFRWRYDADNDEFQLQQNTATEANPTWSTIIKIRESDGRVTVTGTGGLLATGGFYNFGGLDVAVTEAGGAAFGDVGTLLFDSNSGFYIHPDSSGRPIVSVNVAAAAGTITDGANLGSGSNVFKQKVASTLQFRSITAGTNVTVQENTDDIQISASDTGEVNTASNLGSGFGIWFDKQGVDLRFKSLTAGSGVNLSATDNEITIAAPEFYLEVKESESGGFRKRTDKIAFDSAHFYVTTGGDGAPLVSFGPTTMASSDTASNLGGGEGVFAQKSGTDFQFKSLTAGSNITLTSSATEIEIASTASGGGGFYGIVFKESEASGYRHRDDEIVFDSAYFYLTSDNRSKPFVSLIDQQRFGSLPEATKTSNFTITRNEIGTNVNANNATTALTFSLAPVAGFPTGATFQVRNINTADLTVDPDSSETINGASTLTVMNGQTARIWSTGTAWRAFVGRDLTRRVLSANLDLYVRTDGSDSNSGEANTAAGAFLTIATAVTKAYSIDMSGFTITINVGSGTYTTPIVLTALLSGPLVLVGDTSTPSNVVISTTSATAITVGGPNNVTIRGFKITTTTSGHAVRAINGATVLIDGAMEYGALPAGHVQIFCQSNSNLSVTSSYSITGGAGFHFQTGSGGNLTANSITVTLTGTPAFTTFSFAQSISSVTTGSVTFSGSATGQRYSVSQNSVINTGGGGANYYPGDSAGTSATGGQYL